LDSIEIHRLCACSFDRFCLLFIHSGVGKQQLKSEDWKRVKVHQWLIYPTETIGVVKCEVIQVDVKIAEPLPTFHYDYPYGKTAESGTVKIKYTINDVVHEEIENLANLVAYSETAYRELLRAYNEWQAYLATANSYKETYLTLVEEKRAE